MTQADLLPRPEPVSTGDPSLKRVAQDPEKARLDGSQPAAATRTAGQEPPNSKARPGRPPRRVPLWTLALAGGNDSGSGLCLRAESLCRRDRRRVHSSRHRVDCTESDRLRHGLACHRQQRFLGRAALVELDLRDFQASAAVAAANLQSAQAAEAVAEAQLNEQSKVIAADEANVQGDRGTLNFAEQQLTRFTALAGTGAGTVESLHQAQSDLTERQAALQRDVSTLAAASGQVDVLRSQTEQAQGNVAQAQAALRQAELNLSYTKIYASSAGTVASRSVQVGNLVQPGQILFSVVPDETYVIANFKETQLAQMRVGQPVTITVDGGRTVRTAKAAG